MICVKLIYILLYNSFTGHLYLYAPLLYIIYVLVTKSLTFTLLLLNVLLFLFSILKYFLIICLNLHFARVASLLTQCLTINVLHMLLSLFLLLQIMLFNYPLIAPPCVFNLQMRLQYFIYELTIVISNGYKKSVY